MNIATPPKGLHVAWSHQEWNDEKAYRNEWVDIEPVGAIVSSADSDLVSVIPVSLLANGSNSLPVFILKVAVAEPEEFAANFNETHGKRCTDCNELRRTRVLLGGGFQLSLWHKEDCQVLQEDGPAEAEADDEDDD